MPLLAVLIAAATVAASVAAPSVAAPSPAAATPAAPPSSPAAGSAGAATREAPSVVAAVPVDPARLAAAHDLLELTMPAANRTAMLATLMTSFSATMRRGIEATPDFKAAMAADPRVRPIFDRFLTRTEARSAAMLETSLPSLFDAIARAYARRFTLPQLADLKAFFGSPTGRYYAATAPTVLTDPDVAAANQALMRDALAHSRDDVAAMTVEIKALPPLKAAPKPGT